MKTIEKTYFRRTNLPWTLLLAGLCCTALLAIAQPTRTNYFIGGAGNERWHQPLNWVTDPLGLGAPQGTNGTEVIVFYTSNKFANARFNLITQFPASGRTNFYSVVFTNGPFDAAMFGNNPPIRVGAGSVTIEPQVSGSIQYRMPTYFDGLRTIANNSTNGTTMTCEADNGGFTTEPAKYWIFNIGANTLTLDGPGSFTFSRGSGAIQGTSAGLTKNGSGAASLQGTNTFTGTIALNAGSLTIGTVHAGNNPVTVADLTTFGATVSEANTTLALSSLTLGNNTTGNVTNVFNLGAFGNPTPGVPVVNATSLAANGTNTINVTGLGLSIGQITLLKCAGTIGGTHTFALGTLPAGRGGQLIVNTDSVVLDITNAPVLLFSGVTNGVTTGVWDINGTSNWVDQTSGLPSYFLNGTTVLFNDTAATKTVLLNTNVQPFNLQVTNTVTYTFSSNHPTASIGGTARLIKEGTGTLILGVATNTYTGFTYIADGILQLTAPEAIGNGSEVTNNAVLQLTGYDEDIGSLSGSGVISNSATLGVTNRLTLGSALNTEFSGQISDGAGPLAITKNTGGAMKFSGNNTYTGGTRLQAGTVVLGGDNVLGTGLLEWSGNGSVAADSTPRTLTNSILVGAVNNITMGLAGAAQTTLSGNVDLSAFDNTTITVNSDVVLNGSTIGNGQFKSKAGPGTLTLRGITGELTGTLNQTVQDGALVLDGARLTNTATGFFVQSVVSNGTARLLLTNNATLAMLGGGTVKDLRIGSSNSTGSNSTDVVEVDGSSLLLTNGAAIDLGRLCANAVLSIKNNGLVQTLAITHVVDTNAPNLPFTEVLFDNATLRPSADRQAFLEGLSNAVVNAGGVTVDSAGFNIAIAQALRGVGGLTKIGAGSLELDGLNTYDGTTLVSAGVLGGTGVISGPLVVGGAGSLAPGKSIGTLTIDDTVQLQGQLIIELNKDESPSNDVLVVTGTINYGGQLSVRTNGLTPFALGDTFQIVQAGGPTGTISVLGTPGDGLAWDFTESTGVLSVVSAAAPELTWTNKGGGVIEFTFDDGVSKLVYQTNSLAVGLSTNWMDYPGGSTSPLSHTNDPAIPVTLFGLQPQ